MTTNWLPGILAAGIGILAALVYLLTSRRAKGSAGSGADAVLGDLNAKFQSLLEQRRALEAERHAMEPAKFTEEATRLERAAAEALRERDALSKSAPASGTGVASGSAVPSGAPASKGKAPGFSQRNPQLVGAMWGALVVGFFGVLAVILVQEQKPRGEDGVMTGRTPPNGEIPEPAQPMNHPPTDPQFEAVLERARTNPEDLETVGYVTHELMRFGRLDEATLLVERGLSFNPFDAELRVHRSVLASLRGEVTRAERELTHLVETYPDAQEALLFLAAMKLESQKQEEALGHLERYWAEAPTGMVPRELLQTIHGLRADLGR